MTRLYHNHQNRIRLMSLFFLLTCIVLLSRLFFIQSFKSNLLRETTHKSGIIERTIKGARGRIFDRNGEVLAQSIQKYTFWVNSNKNFDKTKIITLFSHELQQPLEKYESLLSQNKSYVKLADGLLRTQCVNILSQIKNINGLHYDVSSGRYYPYNNLASQVLGYVDIDQKGQFGLERQFDTMLNGKTSQVIYNRSANGKIIESVLNQNQKIENGTDIESTIDIKIQAILVDALNYGLRRSSAISANGIIINPYTGDILAMASIPDFNPNQYRNYNISTFSNRTISEAYEPGSTFKLISMTAILESGFFTNNDIVFCEEGKYQILPTKFIHDHKPHGNLSISEIFIHSSNIGIAKIIEQLGSDHIYNYARKFGFGIKTGIELPSETSGVLRPYDDWSKLSGTSVSIGQEVSINTLQLALAYSAAANGGYLIKPRIIQKIHKNNFNQNSFLQRPIRKVMSKKTANSLLEMMESVVSKGTANNAKIPGFKIGGKTGTAEKFINGAYSKKDFISSFAAILPINKPEYVCVISVDSPKYGYHWGNETAAPMVKKIFERLIINKNIDVEKSDYANINNKENTLPMLTVSTTKSAIDNKVPNFIGKTLKQSVKTAKVIGLNIQPTGTAGKVTWQSIAPGKTVNNDIKCKIRLESL